MTPLQKRVQRRCQAARDGGRRLVVALDPGDVEVIGLRLERGRKWFRVPVMEVYHLAVKRSMGLAKPARRTGRSRK